MVKKQQIKANIVEAPTLFVGVGGTGSRIVKKVAEMCRPGETENINFVCLDTNVNDLSSVAKSSAHIYYVQTSNTQTVGNYLDYDEDALKNWFPKNAVLYDKTVSEGAGQVRAISRLALNSTIKTGKIRPLYDAVDDLFRKSGQEMKQALRCVVVSTASGGTGSGILLPLSMFIRDYVNNKYPNTSLIVRSLVLLPETLDSVIDSTVERESQRRNAYATIKEINAFMIKGSGFFDIDEDLKRYSNIHVDIATAGTDELKSLSLLPCDFCFLMDGQNAEDSTMISIAQYEQQAAQALYEQNIGPMQKKAFSVEDNIIKEMSNPGNYGRNRFGGIGAGTIRYPYEDIADYVAYDWAIDSIGGEGEAAKWSKYDNEYEVKRLEAKKKGLSGTEAPTRADVYVSKMSTATDNFSKDLRNTYLQNANRRVSAYFTALAEEMHNSLNNDALIRAARDAANELAEEIDYKNNDSKRGKAREHLGLLRDYETAVRKNAQKIAASTAEAIMFNEGKTINEKRPYTLEFLLKNDDEICHPNAARYMLYLAKAEMDKRKENVNSRIMNDFIEALATYSPEANDTGMFDAKYSRKKERNIDELVAAEKGEGQDPNLLERIGGHDNLYNQFNQMFPDYYATITDYANSVAELEAYRLGSEYLEDLCKMYERFYATFGEKVTALLRRQDDLVDSLRFTKGDSVFNVCSSRELLDELSKSSRTSMEDKLDKELNGQIFDAVKANVMFEREIRAADVVEEDRRIDIFDDILLGYFKQSVRRNCEMIEKNIIEAIAMECRLQARIKMREEQDSGDDNKLFDKVTIEDITRHIQDRIAMGERLSAPGIQRLTNVESREIKLCAYNKSLKDMRAFRIDELLPKGEGVDTVSSYELHFFNALYNLTPDKLNKFASPLKTETGGKNAGLYHNAYTSYSKFIGPDSTKNMMISTHIDKRWDAISVMPEMDFEYQNTRMMNIHKAMIYGLIHNAIQRVKLSVAAKGKMVYRYENSDERSMEMVVSNGTLCDEFFEILDALYINSAIVEDIYVVCEKKRARDKVRNSNYADTTFAKDLANFALLDNHDGPTSLFEIPLAYYNSLPNSQRFVAEMATLVDAAIRIFKEELDMWERPDDAKFVLCNILEGQFRLLMENYKKYPSLSRNIPASENVVLSLAYRKIKSVMTTTPEPDDFESTLAELKQLFD
ncbi:MAG: hypothetical protein J1E06_11665 [Acutalibacter sp.]|nr:hypothetical protein [Acutalibacter sp.]